MNSALRNMQKKKKVVLIDIMTGAAPLLQAYFVAKNYEVYITGIFADALVHVKAYQPDVIYLNAELRSNTDSEIIQLKEAAPEAKIFVDQLDPKADF